MLIINKKSYVFGSYQKLSENDFQNLIEIFKAPVVYENGGLAGRGKILKTNLENLGDVIVKHYKRGGLIRHFVKQRYLKKGKTRAEKEFQMLEKARSFGVKAPEPIAWAYHGKLFYKGWLIIKEIKNSRSLAEFFSSDPENIEDVLSETANQVNILIRNNILHVDLHPGNVLLVKNNEIFIIDFDKSKITTMNDSQLRNFYIARWQRAVIKYGMHPQIATLFKNNLLSMAV